MKRVSIIRYTVLYGFRIAIILITITCNLRILLLEDKNVAMKEKCKCCLLNSKYCQLKRGWCGLDFEPGDAGL